MSAESKTDGDGDVQDGVEFGFFLNEAEFGIMFQGIPVGSLFPELGPIPLGKISMQCQFHFKHGGATCGVDYGVPKWAAAIGKKVGKELQLVVGGIQDKLDDAIGDLAAGAKEDWTVIDGGVSKTYGEAKAAAAAVEAKAAADAKAAAAAAEKDEKAAAAAAEKDVKAAAAKAAEIKQKVAADAEKAEKAVAEKAAKLKAAAERAAEADEKAVVRKAEAVKERAEKDKSRVEAAAERDEKRATAWLRRRRAPTSRRRYSDRRRRWFRL